MLINNFYSIQEINSLKNNPGKFEVKIELNEKNEIYDGHFPGNPVVPGVCLIQIVKEVLSGIVKKELVLVKADNIKFKAVVNPEINKVLDMELDIKYLDDGVVQVKNVIFHGEKVFFKFAGSFK